LSACGAASSNITNHHGLRRQSIAAPALSPGTNGSGLIHAAPKAGSRSGRICQGNVCQRNKSQMSDSPDEHSSDNFLEILFVCLVYFAVRLISVTTSLTCFLSPRRGHAVSHLLLAQYASCQLHRTTFQETGERFTFSPVEKAGMRASVKPFLY
jgi:hypothetical protein